MNKEEIILIGGGGHCKSVIDVIESGNKYKIAGIVDIKEKIGESLLGYKVFASDDDIEKLVDQYKCFLITTGQIKSNSLRVRLYNSIKQFKGKFATIFSPYAKISSYADIGQGTVVMHNSIVNANAKIGVNCIINTSSIIEHDAIIEDHCHISTGAIVNGSCNVGKDTFIGSNVTLVQGVKIGNKNIIGAGSVVLKNTVDNSFSAGNPAFIK